MDRPPAKGHGRGRFGLVVLALVLVAAAVVPAAALSRSSTTGSALHEPAGFQGDFLGRHGLLQDFDARTGKVAPTAGQKARVRALGATARWNRFGTPASLSKAKGYLATGLGSDPATAARRFVTQNASLFRLDSSGLSRLNTLNVNRIGPGAAVLFRQRFGTLPAVQDGLLTVGVVGGKIAYVSSSIAGNGSTPPAAALSPKQAFAAAAASVGLAKTAADITAVKQGGGWTLLRVGGMNEPQRLRLKALPLANGTVRPVYETDILDDAPGKPTAFVLLVDAVTGKVLVRHNAVDYATEPTAGAFQGTTNAGNSCGPLHSFDVPAGSTEVDVVATANVPADDIVLNLIKDGKAIASSDTATSPEAIHYSPPTGLEAGPYAAQVCQYEPGVPPFDYSGAYATVGAATTSVPYPPKWRVFPYAPPLDYSSADNRELDCWVTSVDGSPIANAGQCDRQVANTAARAPWDFDQLLRFPSFTTQGNAATTAVARAAGNTVIYGSVGPAEQNRPFAADRNYDYGFTNQWYESKCDPTLLADPKALDADAATTNLFVGHNKMHDWSYYLGFTENTYNLQESNFGNGTGQPGPYPVGRELDPEEGNVQDGALLGGPPTYGGRDNANQITLQDGIPGITNQYLFQPIAAAFYAPCVDGDFDFTVFGHEYTHAISNRMVGGPDAGLTGQQAGSMGESWSDLTALEVLHEYDEVPAALQWVLGPYVTGDEKAGIRNYPLTPNPLNYSDVGYDVTGAEVHADGEIWNAANYAVRQSLVSKWNGSYPASDKALQRRCADGKLPASHCPGNRRWIQLVFDAYLLQQPATSMVDARDAMLAADEIRFGGANQAAIWSGFAKTGLGKSASTASTNDVDPKPGFDSPYGTNANVTFNPVAVGTGPVPKNVRIFVGDYEARVTPVADTDGTTSRPSTAAFVPGTYRFVARAPGFGMVRFTRTLSAGASTVTIPMAENLASAANGAAATGSGVNHQFLIDDTEATDWASLDAPVVGRTVTVNLAGTGARTVGRVNVSAMVHAATKTEGDPDNGSQSRFSALRSFEIETCNAAAGLNCSLGINYKTIYTSRSNAFPAGVLRPRAPQLILRSFDVPATEATHVRLRVLTNQCTGAPAYQGDQDNDPLNPTDCSESSAQARNVRAAELQVFSR